MSLKERDVVLTTTNSNGDTVIQLPITRIENVERAIKTVNGVKPDSNGNVNATGLPVGFEYFQTNPNVRAGSLPLTGGLYSRELYADFWSWIQEQSGYLISEAEWQAKASANGGAVPFYSDGDGSTTFRVPALTVWVKGANGDEAVGDYLADQFKSHKHNVSVSLANNGAHTHTRGTMDITGWFEAQGSIAGGGNATGAFTTSNRGTVDAGTSAAATYQREVTFKASNSWSGSTSSAGGHNHTVTLTEATRGGSETRPKTIIGIYCVVAFTTATPLGSVNLDSLQKSINETKIVIESAIDITRNAPTIADPNDQSSTQIVNAAYLATNNYVVRTYGDQTISGTKTFNDVINGTAMRANWADLAEIYQADAEYQPGTLVAFGGEKEITVATAEVNAVVSTKPALLMNNNQKGTPIALIGRVPVRVIGKVAKFDKLVLDKNNPGVAKVDNTATQSIARALESNEDQSIKLVLCATMFAI